MLTRLGLAAYRWADTTPWTNVYGLARTLLALGTLGTLVFSPASVLFVPVLGSPQAPNCTGLGRMSLFCAVPDLSLARFVAIGILLVAASGWRPRLTALPHWWVAFSVPVSISIPDGGDHVTQVLTLLILPVALTDRRRWHWAPATEAERPAATLVAVTGMTLVRLQVAGIYLHASVAKLGTAEWRDGTALYYWLVDPTFGTPGWLRHVVNPAMTFGPAVAALTWGTMVLEFALALGFFVSKQRRWPLLWGGIALHAGIAVFMGLPSFALAMFGALVLFLRPWDQEFGVPRVVTAGFDRIRVRGSAATAASGAPASTAASGSAAGGAKPRRRRQAAAAGSSRP